MSISLKNNGLCKHISQQKQLLYVTNVKYHTQTLTQLTNFSYIGLNKIPKVIIIYQHNKNIHFKNVMTSLVNLMANYFEGDFWCQNITLIKLSTKKHNKFFFSNKHNAEHKI